MTEQELGTTGISDAKLAGVAGVVKFYRKTPAAEEPMHLPPESKL